MFVWYFKEENTLRFWRLCGRIEKTRRKETAVTLQQLRYVTAVAGTGTISHAVQQFYISQPSLTNAIRELEQEVGLALSKTASSVVSRTLLDARGQMSAKSMHPPAYGQRKCQKKKGVQEKMKHLHKGGWCHPHSTRRLAFCRGCRIRQNTTPAKGALPGCLSPPLPLRSKRMARYHVQTAYARFKVLYEESRTQCRHYVRLLFYELSACHSASEASNTATLYPAKRR